MAKINKPSIATDTSLLVVGHNRGVGFSEKVNYNSETREQVIKLVLKGEKSAIDTELVKRALSNAIMQRGHHDRLTFHSDRGVQYIELFYNRKRLHSSLGYMTPVEYRLSRKMVNSISNPANMATTIFLLSKKTTKIQ